MAVINCTPHEVIIMDNSNEIIRRIPSCGILPRCAVSTEAVGEIEGIPIHQSTMGGVEGMPDPVEGTMYIVSRVIAEAVKPREDVIIPDDLVRDGGGRIIGCRRFARI